MNGEDEAYLLFRLREIWSTGGWTIARNGVVKLMVVVVPREGPPGVIMPMHVWKTRAEAKAWVEDLRRQGSVDEIDARWWSPE